MLTSFKEHKLIQIVLILSLLFGALFFINQHNNSGIHNPLLSRAIIIDFILVVPLIYFLIIRKTTIPKTTIVPVIVIGFLIARNISPDSEQAWLDFFQKWVLPILELGVLTFVVIKVRRTILQFQEHKIENIDFYSALKSTCHSLFPPIAAHAVSTEVAVFYYGFFKWGKPKYKDNEFTYHRNSGSNTLVSVFIFLIVVETIVFHILLGLWSNIAAWILTSLSIYSGLQLFGYLKSLSRRPIVLGETSILFRNGIFSETSIPYSQIESIEASSKELPKVGQKLSILGDLESHNIIIRTKQPIIIERIYGIKKESNTFAGFLDEEVHFIKKVNEKINEQ